MKSLSRPFSLAISGIIEYPPGRLGDLSKTAENSGHQGFHSEWNRARWELANPASTCRQAELRFGEWRLPNRLSSRRHASKGGFRQYLASLPEPGAKLRYLQLPFGRDG